MAHLSEDSVWEPGVYQLETTDPVIGGPDGVSNVQGRQLGNRTKYLKDVSEGLAAAVAALEGGVGEEAQNALWAAALQVASDVGVLAKEIDAQRYTRHQQGVTTIYNRGVKGGCVVTKSGTATRNLNLAAGVTFYRGRTWAVEEQLNGASVPSNTGGTAILCEVYLDAEMNVNCTPLGEAAPEDALVLATITVPAGSTDATDPNMASCTITPVARQEPLWPGVQVSPAYDDIALARKAADTGYALGLDIVSWVGGEEPAVEVLASDRAVNTFRIYLGGAADAVTVRYVTHLMRR